MKYNLIFLFFLSLVQVSCKEPVSYSQNAKKDKSTREGAEIDLLTYSIPPRDGHPVSVGTLSELRDKGIPVMEEDIEKAKKQKSWEQMDSLFQANYHSFNDGESKFVFEEHLAQIILKDFGLLLKSDQKSLERIAFYTEILLKNKGVHSGHIYLGINQLKSYWSKDKIKEYAQITYDRTLAEVSRMEEPITQIKQRFSDNTKGLPPQELARAEKVVGKMIKTHDENVYFLKKLKTLIEE